MNIDDIDLCASYWTIAGETYPGAPSELSPFSLKDRAQVAGRIGWRGMGLVMDDLTASIDKYGMSTVRDIFADNGIRHVELEFLVDWHLGDARRLASDGVYERMLDIAGQIVIRKIKVGGGVFEQGKPDIPAMRDAMAKLCEKAAPYNVDIVVEFLPFASINSIQRGLEIFEGIDAPNGGLLVDTWHVQRGGMTAADIRAMPLERLKAVELDDAALELNGDLFNDSTHYRRLCGEGEIDIAAQVQAILDVGYRGYWGVEVISAQHRMLPLETAAKRAFETTMDVFRNVELPAAAAA